MDVITSIVLTLTSAWPYVLMAIFVIILVILGYLFVVIRAAQFQPSPRDGEGSNLQSTDEVQPEGGVAQEAPSASPLQLRRGFAESIQWLRANVGGRNYRYQIPWFMMVGEAGSGKTSVLGNTGMNLLLAKPAALEDGARQGCRWWFFDKGVVLDIAGDFVLGGHGKRTDDQGWHTLLRLLQSHRPQRPIDGVMLTIPCTDLIGPPRAEAERLTQSAEKADQLYQRLWQAQKALGMCLPITILVTKCDVVQGFKSFCREIPPRLHREMFGWPNPYAPGTAFAPTWIDEAVQSLHSSLQHIQIEVIAEQHLLWDGDGLFLFPAAFQALVEPLQVYINRLFRSSAYHEAFLFRGIYFCGDGDLDTREPAPLPGGAASEDGLTAATSSRSRAPFANALRHRPLFLKHLFERKIFPEYALARPVAKTLLSRNRALVITQGLLVVTALVGGVGLWRAYDRLATDKATILPVLQEIADDLQGLGTAHAQHTAVDATNLEDHTVNLLRGMANIRTNHLASIFLPSSWVSSIHRDITRAITLAYDRIILKNAWYGFGKKVSHILSDIPNIRTRDVPDDHEVFIWKMPEFLALQTFVDEVEELEQHIDIYNNLHRSKKLTDVAEIQKYLFAVELPEDFYSQAGYYQEALGSVRYAVTTQDLKAQMIAKLRALIERFYGKVFESNILLTHLQDISRKVDHIRLDGRSAQRGIVDLRDLSESIRMTQALLASPALAWLADDRLDLGDSFNRLLWKVQQSAFFGPALQIDLQRSGEQALHTLKIALARQETALTGPLLQRQDGKFLLQLSTEALALKGSLEKFIEPTFVGHDGTRGASPTRPMQRTGFLWDIALLEEAVKVYQRYDNELNSVPLQFEPTITPIVLGRVETKMSDLIAQAQGGKAPPATNTRPQAEESIRVETTNFRNAVPLLAQLLSIFEQQGLATSALSLASLAASQASSLLAAVDRLLLEDRLYGVKGGNFAWWDGRQPVAYAAYDVRNAAGLGQFLELQRERLRYLAKQYAEPPVTFLANDVVQRDQLPGRPLLKWQNILTELESYDSKKPGNSVATLEKFILSDLGEINIDNCFQKLTANEHGVPGRDYFLHIRNQLQTELYQQCRVIASQEMLRDYTAVGALFNKQLAGRFPFSDHAGGDTVSEAQPEAIQAFYRMFDKRLGNGQNVLRHSSTSGPSTEDEAAEFLNQIAAVRAFFAGFLDGAVKQRFPVFGIQVDFRVNQAQEIGGNRVIDWTLDLGEQQLRYRDAERQGRWRYGDPVRLSLRWAKDSPVIPVVDPRQSRVRVSDETVVYEYTNHWSLISFLREHALVGMDGDRGGDRQPHMLRFDIPTNLRVAGKPADGLLATPLLTKVFIRLTLTAADQQDPMVLPTFPRTAPPLAQDAKR